MNKSFVLGRNSRNWRIFFLCFLPLLAALACTAVAQDPSARKTEIAVAIQQTQLAMKAATLEAQAQQAAETAAMPTATVDVQATRAAQSTADAEAAATRKVENAQATTTQAELNRENATQQAADQATQQAQPLYDWVQKLADEGTIPSTEGKYYHLDDFDESVAKINYFSWWRTGYSASEFVLLTDMAWDVASKSANWYNTGCGFVFSEAEEGKYHFMQLGLDGLLSLFSIRDNNWTRLAQKTFGKPSIPSGQATVMMVVFNKRVKVYVDERQIFDAYSPLVAEGKISLSLSSGTNSGFGTRCRMTNSGLWIIK